MDSPDRPSTADLARRQQRLRAELESQARVARRALADQATRARAAVDQQAQDARRKVAASDPGPTRRPSAGGALGAGGDLEDKALVWIVPAAGVAAIPLVVGHVSALVVNGEAPSYSLGDVPGILGRLVGDPGDPAGAWAPVNTGGVVPGATAFWATFAFVVVVVTLVGLLVWAAVRPPAKPTSGWGAPDDQRGLWLARKERGRLVLGAAGNHLLAVRERHSVLLVGPAHGGKTSGLVVPAVVEWEGPVVVAATKGHLVDETIGWRSRQGDVHVYDPAAITRYHRSGWSMLADCGTWSGAIRTAADLTLAARASSRVDPGDGDQAGVAWRSSLSMALAPFLLAAVASGRTIGQTAEWIENEERDEVLTILVGLDQAAARAHRTTFARPDPVRSRFLHAMHEILSVYDDPVVAASMDRHDLEPAELLDGGANTLYLTTPEYDQERFRPLCGMIVRRIVAAAYEISARSSAPLDPPLLVVLDDVTGIAPVDDLAALASTAAARGVQVVSVFQDRAQIDGQYGDVAATLVRNHGARVVLPDRHERGLHRDDPLLDPALARDLGEHEAALVYGSNLPLKISLRPWFADRELRRRVETPQDAVRPAMDDDPIARESPAEQTAAWLRRTGGRPVVKVDDPTIPFDIHDRAFVEVFGSVDEDDTGPLVLRPRPDRRWRRR